MKSINRRSRIIVALAAALVVSFAVTSVGLAQGRKKNPTSKIFVTSVNGNAQIDTGQTIDALTQKSVYSAEGTVIQTQEKSDDSMVFSNGTGAFLDPNTRLEIRKFVQEPFKPSRDDMNVEPSISNTQGFLSRGSLGLCTSKMVAGSVMNYGTPDGSVRIKGRKVVLQVDENGTTVTAIEGEMTVHAGNLDAGGTVIKQGQQAIIPRGGGAADVKVQSIPPSQVKALEDRVTSACMARKAVYFEASQKVNSNSNASGDITAFDQEGADGQTIIAIPTTPAVVPPSGTVSVANLPKS